MSSTTTEQTIAVMHRLFAQFELPEQVISDNGPGYYASVNRAPEALVVGLCVCVVCFSLKNFNKTAKS